jgi:hypothetical protein
MASELKAQLNYPETVPGRGRAHGPRSFFVQGAATVAIEPDALEAARRMLRAGAGVAELVDAPDLGSGGENRGGSSPSARTSLNRRANF